jgi:iron complex outermembrane receptor protein
MKFSFALLAAALAATSGPVAAEVTEDLFLADLPTVLTASRIEQSPLDAPAPVTVIDRETIRASGFTEIHDLLRLVPGFLVADWPGGSPVVVNHGLGDARSRRMQVLIDGRSAYEPLQGGVDWQDLPIRIEDIERIEVVRAPNQASYGANAFMGVINIITRQPFDDHGLGIAVSRGRLDFEDNYARLGGQAGEVGWRISASSRQATNFRDLGYEVPHPIPQAANWRETYWRNELVDRQTLVAQASVRPAPDQELRVDLGLSQGEDRIGSTSPAYADDPAHRRSNRNRYFQLAWSKSSGDDSELSLKYYHLDRSVDERYAIAGTSATLPVDKGVEISRDDLELQQYRRLSETLKGVWGVGVRHDRASSDYYLYGLGEEGGTQWQLFGNLDWQAAPNWLLHAGGMVERHYNTGTLFSPRLAANYAITPTQSLRLSAGRGYRAPTIYESSAREAYAYDGGIADVNNWQDGLPIEPESVDFIDLGYVGRYSRLGLLLDARVFLEKYRNYIDTNSCILDPAVSPTPNVARCPFPVPDGYERPLGFPGKGGRFGHYKAFYSRNSGDILVSGGDISLDWRHAWLGRVVLAHAITQIRASSGTDRDTEVSAPQHATSLLWSRDLPWRTRISVGYYQYGYMMWPTDGDHQPAYERVDLKLAKRFGKKGAEDEIALTWQNLNGSHQEFDYYTAERQAFVTLRLSW